MRKLALETYKVLLLHEPEHNGHGKRDTEEYFLPECPDLQGQLAAEALELADPVEKLENTRHRDARQRKAEPRVVPMFEVGVKIVA